MAFLARATRNQYLNNFESLERKALAAFFPDPGVGIGAAAGTGVSALEYRDGDLRKTVITLSALAQAVVNGTEYQGDKIYDFPLGLIQVNACYGTIAQTTTSAIASTLNSGAVGALAFGTATASSTTLDTTMANLAPSTAFASSATINVAGTAVSPILLAPININGAGTAADMYINTAYATTGEVDADATQTLSGTIIIIWRNLGALA